MSLLTEIFARKRDEAAARTRLPVRELEALARAAPPPPDFSAALRRETSLAPRLIAEVKRRSPSRGVLRTRFDPCSLARTYAENGAAAISVLTDEPYFGGSLEHLRRIAALDLGLPLLRKDFIFDRYQLLEARAAGASAVLLIVAMLDPALLGDLIQAAGELGLEALVETHTPAEIETALRAGARIVGINNRDLHTFQVRLETALRLRPLIPPGVAAVAESGIRTSADVARLAKAGMDALLIGEALVTAPDVAAKVRALAGLEAG